MLFWRNNTNLKEKRMCMRLSKKKILAVCMSGALILSSVPGVYMESTAAKKSSVAVVKLSETNLKLVKGKQKMIIVTN